MRYEKTGEAENKWTASLKAILFGFCAGAIVCTVCLLIFAFLFTQAKLLPLSMIRPLVLVACLFASFVGGFCAARKRKMQGMFYGLITALVLFGVLALISAVKTAQPFTFYALVACFSMLLLGAIGGILGVNKKNRRK